MRGAYFQYIRQKGISRYTDAVEALKAKRQRAAERRLALRAEALELKRARIMNGAEPAYQNGHSKDAEKGRVMTVNRKKKGRKKGY